MVKAKKKTAKKKPIIGILCKVFTYVKLYIRDLFIRMSFSTAREGFRDRHLHLDYHFIITL